MSMIERQAPPPPFIVPAGLDATDQLLKRWGAGSRDRRGGSLHPLERLRMLRDGTVFSEPVPPPKEFEIIDNVLATCEPYTKNFIVLWYCEMQSVRVKATTLGYSKTQMYVEWRVQVSYVRGRLHARGLQV